LPQEHKYTLEFENTVAEYTTGNPCDRSETLFELYTKLGCAHSFFAFCERYFDLAGKRFIEVGWGTAYVWASSPAAIGSTPFTIWTSSASAPSRFSANGSAIRRNEFAVAKKSRTRTIHRAMRKRS
jgi:hypothetical protein